MSERQQFTPPHSEQQWDPQPIVEWLIGAGRDIDRPDLLTAELGHRLAGAGAPIFRMRVGMRTLNPLVLGCAYTWWKGRDDIDIYSPPHSVKESSDYVGSPIEAVHQTHQPYRCRFAEADPDSLHSSLRTLEKMGATDYLAQPLQFTYDEYPTPWILTTDRAGGFSDTDIRNFDHIARYLAPVLEVLALHKTAQSLLDTYLGPRTGRKVLQGQVRRGDGEQIEAAIWYSDMRDSTAITEELSHDQLLTLLNHYFEAISTAVSRHGGEVLRFIGDAMLVVFPTDSERNLVQASEAALAAARDAHDEIQRINPQLEADGLPAIRYGLGLEVGQVIYGNVGAPDRLDFTVLGSAVNRAARIENLTKEAGCSLLVSEQFASLLDDTFTWLGDFSVAGVDKPLSVYCATCDYQQS